MFVTNIKAKLKLAEKVKKKLELLPHWPTDWEKQEGSSCQGRTCHCSFTHLLFETFSTNLTVFLCVAMKTCLFLLAQIVVHVLSKESPNATCEEGR